MDEENFLDEVKIGAFDNGRGERETPSFKRNYRAFVKKAVAFNLTGVTKCIRIGVVGTDSKFRQFKECKELNQSMPCEVRDIHLREDERIQARFEDVKIDDILILRYEGKQYDSTKKDLSSRDI